MHRRRFRINGDLQVDGNAGYVQTSVTLAGCWAHICRKFIKVQQAKGKRKIGKADWASNQLKKLYVLETKLKTQPFEVKPL